MITVVCKHFEAMGQQLTPGMVVDSSSWLHEGKMLEQRRLRLANDDERKAFFAGDTRLPRAPETKGTVKHARA